MCSSAAAAAGGAASTGSRRQASGFDAGLEISTSLPRSLRRERARDRRAVGCLPGVPTPSSRIGICSRVQPACGGGAFRDISNIFQCCNLMVVEPIHDGVRIWTSGLPPRGKYLFAPSFPFGPRFLWYYYFISKVHTVVITEAAQEVKSIEVIWEVIAAALLWKYPASIPCIQAGYWLQWLQSPVQLRACASRRPRAQALPFAAVLRYGAATPPPPLPQPWGTQAI